MAVRVYQERKDILNMHGDSDLVKIFRLDGNFRCFATGKMQLCDGDDLGISQQSASRVISDALNALATLDFLARLIKFPTMHDEIQQKRVL